MLILWTQADAQKIKSVIGPILYRNEVPHRFVPDITKIPDHQPDDVILSFGAKALALLQSLGVCAKARTVTSLRETPHHLAETTIFVTFDPGLAFMDYARLPEIQWDIQLAIRMHNTGTIRPKIGEYRFVESLHELIERIDAKYEKTGNPVNVAFDLETKSLDEYAPGAWIIAASFTVDKGKSDVLYFEKGETLIRPQVDGVAEDYWEGLWIQVHWILNTPKVSLRGANLKYDCRWVNYQWGIDTTNFKFDTLLVGSLLDENRSNSLKLHVKLFTPMGGYEDDIKNYDMGALELVPKPKLLEYVGGDTDGTYQVADVMKAELVKDKALTNFYINLLHPASRAFEKMERNGLLVDVPYYHELETELEAEIARLGHEMVKCLPNKLRIKYKDSIAESFEKAKSPLKPAMLKEFLFSSAGLNLKPQVWTAGSYETGGKKLKPEVDRTPSTAMDHLMMFESDPIAANFISYFKEYGSASKTLSTFVVGFLKHLRSDGRFHSTYLLAKMDFEGESESGTNCLTSGSLLLTDSGWKRITLITPSDKVLTHAGNWKRVFEFIENGVKEVLQVRTKEGHALNCTPNHKFWTPDGWVRADLLTSGQKIFSYGEAERWAKVTGFELYEVSSWGRVRNSKTFDVLSSSPKGKWGHRKITLVRGDRKRENGNRKDFALHRLVAAHFVPNESQSPEVRHLDGVAGNNCAWNLVWGSSEDNSEDARKHGTLCREGQSHTKLDWGKVAYIRSHSVGYDNQLAAELGVSRELVRDVRLFKKWITSAENTHSYSWGISEVVSVEYLGELPTYDATVEEDHSYVANGLITHNTGRTSAKSPAIQTLTKHSKWAKKLRRAFIAPPGYVILQLDYSQGELRITAVLAKEPTMIKAYNDGFDLHAITAAQLNKFTLEQFMALPEETRDALRSGGKAGNFGLIYGMMENGFREYAYTTYGVSMTPEEAFEKREAFFDLYNRLPEWHNEYKNFAHLHGYVRSPLGRVRHLPFINSKDNGLRSQAERQCINAPVQSCLSDMMMLAMVHIGRQYPDADIHTCMMTHDSVGIYIPEDEQDIWPQRIKTIMENLPLKKDFGFDSPLKFTVDAEVSALGPDGVYSLASLKKVKGLIS